jgi:tRNA-2-methylthio-N6-dimethylallyladenosine synthase
MRTVRYDDAFMYRYSERDGTPATRLPRDQFVSEAVGQARLERLIELHRQIQAEIYQAEVGRVEEVLVEKEGRRGGVQGRTESNKVVNFHGPASLIGTFAEVRLTSTTGATFAGELVSAPEPAELAA